MYERPPAPRSRRPGNGTLCCIGPITTTHSQPTYQVDSVTHYCVSNMPGAVPITSTYALTNATLPYVLALAERGVEEAIARDPGLRPGVNVARGAITNAAVAEAVGLPFTPVDQVLGSAPRVVSS